MGTITKARHYHVCMVCGVTWPHEGYDCDWPPAMGCTKHPTPSLAKQSAKEAVADMAQKMRDLHDPTQSLEWATRLNRAQRSR